MGTAFERTMRIAPLPPPRCPAGDMAAGSCGAAGAWPASPAPARAWEQVLDREALARLGELDPGGKGGLVERVLATYTQSLTKLLDQLAAARSAADLQGMRHVAHTLKSSSASVGALQLSALCADIEHRVREGQSEGLDARLDAMTAEGRRVLAALRPPQPPAA